MTPEQEQLVEIQNYISALDEKDKVEVEDFATTFKTILKHGGSNAATAFGYIGAAIAASE